MEPSIARKVLDAVVGVTLISWSFLLFGYSDAFPVLSVIGVVIAVWGMCLVAGTWIWRVRQLSWRDFTTLSLFVLALISWCWVQVHIAPSYGTDESAFDQYAAHLFLQGHNPYAASMAPAFHMFHMSPNGYTFTLSGQPVTQLSYPSLSFLIYLPMLWLGISHQAAIILNVMMWCLSVVLVTVFLPKEWRMLSVIVGSMAIFTGFAVGGVTDVLYLPFLILALRFWELDASTTWLRRWVSPIAMGLAISVKQTPWLVFIFLIITIFMKGHLERDSIGPGTIRASKYVLRTGLVFLIVNAYFIAWSPGQWIRGLTTPMLSHAVPAGQGLIALSNILNWGSGSVGLFGILEILTLLLAITLYIRFFDQLQPVFPFIASIVLFFAVRSFASYLVMLILPTLITMSSVPRNGPATPMKYGSLVTRALNATSIGLIGGVVLVATLFFGGSKPVDLRIDSIETTGQLATIIRVHATATNSTTHVIQPIFTAESGGALTVPWIITVGPKKLQPHQSAVYILQAPNFFAQPSLLGGFQLAALTTDPGAMSVSRPYLPSRYHVILEPEAFNHPVLLGQPVRFEAQVVDAFNRPVEKSGIRVFLGQIIYSQQGLIFSQASINFSPTGQTPVQARTDSHGKASFTITGSEVTTDPVYFEGNLIDPSGNYPYGYSDIVPILFTSTSR